MYEWTEKRIMWYQRAVAYTGFDEKIADAIEPFLMKNESVCDLGCGTGYAAMALAKHGYAVTAFDKNELTAQYLRKESERRGLMNIEIRLGDWFALSAVPEWDTVVMIFAGHLDIDLKYFLSLCRKQLLLIIKKGDQSHVQDDGVTPLCHATPDDIEICLKGYRYVFADFTAEFGQPLESEAECREYIGCFGGSSESPTGAISHIVRTDTGVYPFYLPNNKTMRLYAINTEKKL